MSCGVGLRLGSDPVLLCLRCGPAAVALIRPLVPRLPYTTPAHAPPKMALLEIKPSDYNRNGIKLNQDIYEISSYSKNAVPLLLTT